MYSEREIQEFIDKYKPDFIISYDGGPRELIMVRYQGNAEEVTIPKGINEIGWNYPEPYPKYCAFFQNQKIKKVTIQEDVTCIWSWAFAGCTNLKTVIFPKSLRVISEQAFAFCENLESIDIYGGDNSYLYDEAFLGCYNLKKITFLNHIEEIGDRCFKGCINLEELYFPSITKIGEGAFENIENLRKVVFRDEIRSIGKNCFAKNANLEEVLFLNSNLDKTFYLSIEDCAFLENKKLKRIVFPNNLLLIGTEAFSRCHSLEEVILPESLIEIGENAFCNCRSLKEIIIPSNIEIIPDGTFYECTDLKNVTLPEKLEEIGARCFKGCKNLEKIKLPKGLKYIKSFAFCDCLNLSTISFPEGLEEIGYGAFNGCNNISSIDLPITIKSLSKDAFNKTKVKSYTVRGIPFAMALGDNMDIMRIGDNRNIDFLKKGNWIDAIELVSQDKEILKQVILGIPEEDLKSCFWDKINLESFQSNLELFRELGIPKEKISDLFVNNGELISTRMENILDNYNYLDNQNLIDSDDLQKLFFRSLNQSEINKLSGKNKEDQKEILKELLNDYFNKHQQFPPLLNRLASCSNDKERLEVRDALLYITHMELIDFENAKKIEHATKILTRNLFETIVEEDRLAFEKDLENNYKNYIEFNDNYKKYFNAIKSPFYRKLSGINENFFNYFILEMNDKNANSRFVKFFDSLTTIQNWDSYNDSKKRATLLKNEIIGRILYACLVYEKETGISINDIGKIDFIKIMDKMTGTNQTIFTDNTLINRMLEIDPYSFDALRCDTHNLEYQYCVKAKQSGYLFSDEEITHYSTKIVNINDKNKLQEYNDFKQYIEYINNEIGIPKIRKEDKEEYLRRTRLIAKRYLYENKTDDLFSLLRLTDLYLRSNSGYTSISAKGEIIEKTAKEVFDSTSDISQKDRLLYMMYNLNRLAHNITDLNLKVDFVNNRTTNKEEFKNIEQAIKALDELSRFGFNLSIVDGIVSFNTENDTVTEDDYSPLKRLIRDGNDDSRLIDKLQDLVSNKYTNTINSNTIEVIRSNLNTLLSLSATGFLNQTNKEKIRTYAEERALFFDVKAIVAEELLNLSIDELGNDICQFIDMSKEEKRAFYHENGYIMEIQKDNDDATLVCYSKAFRETFSIHLKNMPPKLHKKVFDYINSDRYEETIANTKLKPPGITLRTEKFNPSYGNKQLKEVLNGGFNGETTEYAIALYNYMEYDLYYQIEELKEKQKSIKDGTCDSSTLEYFEKLNVDEWFKDFDGIDRLSYAGQGGKTILDRIKEQPTSQSDIHCLGVKAKDIKTYKYEIKKKLYPSQKEQRPITTDERTVTELKSLNLNFGTLKTGIKKEEAETPKKK